MRRIVAASVVAICGMLASAPARADWVPPVKGNDTGGIIAFELAQRVDARQLAVGALVVYPETEWIAAVDLANFVLR